MTRGDVLRKGYHDLVRREILELVPLSAKLILDLGCGAGNLGKIVKQRQNCVVHGIELSRGAAEIAAKNLDHVWCDNLNRFDPAFIKQKYDTLVFADILEHLISPWKALQKFTSVLADNGTVIASIPNIAHPWVVANLAKGVWRYEPAGILDITHLRFFTKTSIFQLFYAAGLKIVNIRAHPSDQNPIQYHVTAVKVPVEAKKPAALILILTHNDWGYTKKCLDSIKKKTSAPHKILVIDNGSTDGTVEKLRKDRTVYHIENSHNLGFAKGFNTGLALVDTPYFVICNSDIVVTHNWLSTLIAHIELDKDLLLLGPRTNSISGPQKVKDVPYKSSAALDDYAKDFGKRVPHPLQYFHRIVFFCTLFKTAALQKVGFLDEIYGKGNYEDDDYCFRTAIKKFKTAYDNTVFIHHYGSTGFKKNPEEWHNLLVQNRKKFMDKFHITDYADDTKIVKT